MAVECCPAALSKGSVARLHGVGGETLIQLLRLDGLACLSAPQLPHLSSGDNSSTYHAGL